jgi:hypothetical protein
MKGTTTLGMSFAAWVISSGALAQSPPLRPD